MVERQNPPKCAEWLMRRLFPDNGSHTTLGDLEEVFQSLAQEKNIFRAGFWYWIQCCKSIPHFFSSLIFWRGAMLRNYLKMSFRNIMRHKGFSFINITGLAIGLTCVMFILLWILDELSYDRYHENANRIYRVADEYESEGTLSRNVWTAAPLGPALQEYFPGIENFVRFDKYDYRVSYQNKRFPEKVFFADPQIFDIFTFPLIQGDPKTVLKEPYSLVISEDMARKYFGEENPVGRILTFNDRRDYKITGLFKTIPRNSHFHFDFLGSFIDHASRNFDQWGIQNYRTYILTSKGFQHDDFKQKMPDFIEKYMGRETRIVYKATMHLQPLTWIHLHSHLAGEIEPNGNIVNVYIFLIIGIFILLIACFNYINLSTAKFVTRIKEVGVRKVLGADRIQIIKQFLGESVYLSLIACIIASMLACIYLPVFNSLVLKDLVIGTLYHPTFLFTTIAIVLVVGIISGAYPAFFLSACHPLEVIQHMHKTGLTNAYFRKILIIIQLSVSIIFIVGTVIIINQLDYIRNKPLGFVKEHILNIPIRDKKALSKIETIKNEFLQSSNVVSVSAFDSFLGTRGWNQNYWYEGADTDFYSMSRMRWIPVDHDFLKTYGMKLIAGRDFSRGFPSDVEHAYILNESAVREIGMESPIGKQFKIVEEGTVIGVVKDFHFKSLHEEIEPITIYLYPKLANDISIRIRSEDIPRTIDFLKNKWNELVSGQTFVYSFIDEDFDNMYQSEMRLSKIFIYVTFFTILIACLGLFGLVSLTAESRTKEIGIRKVLGASISGIVGMLSLDFV